MWRKKAAPLAILFLSLGLLCSFTGLGSSSPLPSRQNNSSPEAIDARELFDRNCSKCHGKDGRAKTFRGKLVGARNLTDANWQAGIKDEGIAQAIKEGPGAMPSFEKKFSPAEINSLIAYVRHFPREQPETKKN